MRTSKAVHWREREEAEWAVRHGALHSFKIDTRVIRNRRSIMREATQAELLGKLADSALVVIGFSWWAKELRSDVKVCILEIMPTRLMPMHEDQDVMRYSFEVHQSAAVDEALKAKRKKS